MRIATLISVIVDLFAVKQPVYVWGSPGVGKSQGIRQAAKLLGEMLNDASFGYIDVRAALLDPVDLRGLPITDGDITRWCPPSFFPRSGRGILFLDELAQAAPMIQAALLQLCLERRVGEYVLPDGWMIVAASNRLEDRSGGHRVITALSNRFLHIDVEVHNGDWQTWAESVGLDIRVRRFIDARPALLHKFNPAANERAFPTPRSWEFVARILSVVKDATLFDLVKGCVGDGPAAEFVAFYKVYSALPDMDSLLANPKAAAVPTQADVLYAITGAITEKVKEDVKKGGNAVEYATRLPKEFGVLLFRDLIKINKQLLATNAGRAFLEANRDALIAA